MKSIFTLGAVFLACASPSNAIDFTPRVIKAEGEAGPYQYFRFEDKGKAVTYMPPQGWILQGSLNVLHLKIPNAPSSSATVSSHKLLGGITADTAQADSFCKWSEALLPAGAKKLETLTAQMGEYEFDGYKTFEVEVRYVIHGASESATFLFLPRSEDLIAFAFTSRADEPHADKQMELRRLFFRSLSSLAGI